MSSPKREKAFRTMSGVRGEALLGALKKLLLIPLRTRVKPASEEGEERLCILCTNETAATICFTAWKLREFEANREISVTNELYEEGRLTSPLDLTLRSKIFPYLS